MSDGHNYFDNSAVEALLHEYCMGACTSLELRDKVMEAALPLIKNIIYSQGYHKVRFHDGEAEFNDLVMAGWIAIESMLYKYQANAHCGNCYNPSNLKLSLLTTEYIFEDELKKLFPRCPHCGLTITKIIYRGKSKLFSLWTQVAMTSILGYIKSNSKDYRRKEAYEEHLDVVPISQENITKFVEDVKELFPTDLEYHKIAEAILTLDLKPCHEPKYLKQYKWLSKQTDPKYQKQLKWLSKSCSTYKNYNKNSIDNIINNIQEKTGIDADIIDSFFQEIKEHKLEFNFNKKQETIGDYIVKDREDRDD